ncbi:MAG: hypothetical protein GY832_17010 [Chloroflexi bacterium]|nr:hypothetical protein [Chloroflexota bacterium]
MNKSRLLAWLTRLAWGILLFDLLLIAVVPADLNFDSELLLIAYAVWLILSLIGAAAWLIVRYRAFFRTWSGWAAPIIAFIISMMVFAGVLPVNHPNLSFFFTLLLLVSTVCIGVATAVLFWYRDVSLKLIGWISVLYIWALVVGWRFQGNLMTVYMSSLVNPNQPSQSLWWINSLMCIMGWVVPLGMIGFIGHTIKLIVRELQ